MKAVRKQYIQDVHHHFNYYPTWLPGTPLQLGDIGTLEKNEFKKISSLENEGILFQVREDTSKMDLDFVSEGGVSIATKLSGSAKPPESHLAEIDAGFIIDFNNENATLFKLKGTLSPSISDTIKLGREIVERYKKKTWEKEWVIITSLVKAESSTIVVSNSRNGIIELKANAGNGSAEITDVSAALSIAYDKGVSLKLITQQHLTPLFKVMGVRGFRNFNARLTSKGISESDFSSSSNDEDTLTFSEVKPEFEY